MKASCLAAAKTSLISVCNGRVTGCMYVLSSSISSISISSPGCLSSERIESRASFGKLKLVLLLEGVLPGLPDEARPLLENDVRRDGGLESPPVAPVLLGDAARPADNAGLVARPFRSSEGMSRGVNESRLFITV